MWRPRSGSRRAPVRGPGGRGSHREPLARALALRLGLPPRGLHAAADLDELVVARAVLAHRAVGPAGLALVHLVRGLGGVRRVIGRIGLMLARHDESPLW